MNEKVFLFVSAHPDDAELAAAGTIAKLTNKGFKCHLLVITGGKSESYDHRVIRTDEEASQEQKKAASLLNIETVTFLKQTDMFVKYDGHLVGLIEEKINELGVTDIFTHNINDTHQDHIAVSTATLSAGRKVNNIFMYEPIAPSGRGPIPFRAQIYVNVTDYAPLKLQSLKCHYSQFLRYGDQWIQAVEARMRVRGFESGCTFSECFELVRLKLYE